MRCPSCGARKVVTSDQFFGCGKCSATGCIYRGAMLYAGVHGRPRFGEGAVNERVDPPLLTQLATVVPELRSLASDRSMSSAFGRTTTRVAYAFAATPFDIEDPDAAEAGAVWAIGRLGAGTRRDEMRFFMMTATIDWGWRYRTFETCEHTTLVTDPQGWLDARLPLAAPKTRSELIGVAALNFTVDDELLMTTAGGADAFEAGFHVASAWLNIEGENQAHGADLSSLREAYRLGLALRSATTAADLVGATDPTPPPRGAAAPTKPERFCTACGYPACFEARFCGSCGHPLASGI